MRNLLFIAVALLFAVVFNFQAAFSADAEKVKSKAKETWEAGKEYTYDKKDEFAKQVRDELKTIDAQMDKIHSDIKKKSSDTQADAQKEWDVLKARREELSKKLDEVGGTSEAAWTDLKNGITSAYDDLKSSVKKARTKFK